MHRLRGSPRPPRTSRTSRTSRTLRIAASAIAASALIALAGLPACRPDLPAARPGLDARPANPTCVAPAKPTSSSPAALAPFGSLGFRQPLLMLNPAGAATRMFVVEKRGSVQSIAADGSGPATTFIDIATGVNSSEGESGLLGMAFHPGFASNHQVFLSYTAYGPGPAHLRSTLSRFTSSDGGLTLDPSSEQLLLTVEQPYVNHNGGNIAFGPDGFLYFGLGDGGSGGDPQGNGQDKDVLLGKMLRIDVDHGAPYAIPDGNPFAHGGGKPEIFAYGLRNPWRWSFDRLTGLLWAGDVGQNAFEEIDVISAGGNYGWNAKEGTHCYNSATCAGDFVEPVVDYGRDQGFSVTGGYVYRGSAIPALVGQYIFGDYGSGHVWAIPANPTGPRPVPQLIAQAQNLASFAQDLAGELYLLDLGGGHIARLVPGSGVQSGGPAALLSQTGCADPADPGKPAAGLIPYDINAPFWSDGARKQRWLALPDGTAIHQGEGGHLDLPPGAVTRKDFFLGNTRVETRLFYRHSDGSWAGASYEWNDAGTDAALLSGEKTKQLGGQAWTFPSPAQCLACHTAAAGFSLGLEAAQLDRAFVYPSTGRSQNQLVTLRGVGLLDQGASVPALPAPDGSAPLEQRARSILHANCAQCHRPGGTGPGDLRFSTSFAATNTCNVAPTAGDLGVAGARRVAPGQPDQSLLLLRMKALDDNRMPPLASHRVDAQSVATLTSWVVGLAGCP